MLQHLLSATTRPQLTAAIASLSLTGDYEAELLARIRYADQDDSYAPFWAIVIMGERKSKAAIEVLLTVFLTDADVLCEAATEALQKIALVYPDEVFQVIRGWVESLLIQLEAAPSQEAWRVLDSEYSGRVYAYGVLEQLRPRPDVRQFLLRMMERDYTMANFIVGEVLHWPLGVEYGALLRRQVELALAMHNNSIELNHDYIEAKWALMYCVQGKTGIAYPHYQETMIDTSWSEQWKWVIDDFLLESNNHKNSEEQDDAQDAPNEEKIEEVLKKFSEDGRDFDAFELPPFDFEQYISCRPRSEKEEMFQLMLNTYGVPTSVEDIQRRINQATSPAEVIDFLNDLDFEYTDLVATEKFVSNLTDLWNHTPREDLHGLTPQEQSLYRATVSPGRAAVKTGRNDLCPCQSGKKFKKCHGV